MQKVKVNLIHCYGIKELKNEFDFTSKSTFVIYAPNGIMKSSFAKTFQDLSNSSDSEDRIYRERTATREIIDENGDQLDPKSVFVIEPYKQGYKSSKISTLLVNKKLKMEYDKIHETINEKKDKLIKELQVSSGLNKEVEETLSDAITHDPKEFFLSLSRVHSEVLEQTKLDLADIQYRLIFNEQVLKVIESKDFRDKLQKYMDVYNRLISSSTFFRKGVFNHNNAADIAQNLKDNGYFQADHTVTINTESGRQEITTEDELEAAIQKEKNSILQDPDLVKLFEEIDKKLTKNMAVRDFRASLEKNKIILPELENLYSFKQKLWVTYLTSSIESYKELMEVYEEGKKSIEEIIQKAKDESTKWANVINIFNERFSVPFIVTMENQEDVILKSEAPSIKFKFQDNITSDEVAVEEAELMNVLSSGERRALYILNIIFEVEARKEANQETLFVIDDIADSFDYKNKYAIVEYLKEISEVAIFYQIILSHNFDFYRTICGRLDLERNNKLHTLKSADSVVLKAEKYQKNPFDTWKNNLSENEELIASIPFIRNLAEYCGNRSSFDKLTSLLHIKNDTNNITIADLEDQIKTILDDQTSLTLNNHDKKVIEVIYETANSILSKSEEDMDLETKIVLSIAIRLKTEEFLISKINDPTFVEAIERNQTFNLIQKYKELNSNEKTIIKLVEQVNLMTPENIHLNSFMYEPILDMSNEHLKKLYQDVQDLK